MGIPIGTKAVNDQTGHQIVLTEKGWQELGGQQMPLPQADEDAIKRLHQETQDAQFLDQKGQQFIQAMDPHKPGQGSFATGPAYGAVSIPHLAENINPLPTAVGAMDPRMGDLESITNQAWVHMRPAGSGAIRGYEATDFKDAFPNVTHWGPENQQIALRLHQDALIAAHKLQFIDSFIRSGHGDYASANAAWQANFGNPQVAAQQPAQDAPPPQPSAGPPPIQPPMQMAPDPQSPIGASPAPGAPLPPQLTQQQQAILNWTPDKGLHP